MRIDGILRYLEVVLAPGSIRAIATWPKFSIASFKMVSALARQGVIPRTVIDVGANVGQFTVAAAKIFPGVEVHSFEPIPECVAALKENTRTLPNIKVYPLALGERVDRCSFRVNSHSQSSSMLTLAKSHLDAFPEEREARTIDIKMTTLDSMLADVPFKHPTLLKLDVQGYEAKTIAGGRKTLQRCDFVVLEASFRPMYDGEPRFTEILSLMSQNNFEFLRPIGWLSNSDTGEVLQLDALFRRLDTKQLCLASKSKNPDIE